MARDNGYATFVRCHKGFEHLIEISNIFSSAIEYMKNSKEYFALLFFIQARSRFWAALRLATATQIPEAYALLRVTLENALYGWYTYKNKHLAETWLRRHESEAHMQEVKNKFVIREMLDLLIREDDKLGGIVKKLYDRCIDFGAHPNELALSSSLKITETEADIRFDVSHLTDDGTAIVLCLKTSAQVGAACLNILKLIIPERFEITQLDTKLNTALRGL
jgi:hypothetical protein